MIFVNGCFWHGHDCPRGSRTPKTNTEYWVAKIERNKVRDKNVRIELDRLGWRVLDLWECEIIGIEPGCLLKRLRAFLYG